MRTRQSRHIQAFSLYKYTELTHKRLFILNSVGTWDFSDWTGSVTPKPSFAGTQNISGLTCNTPQCEIQSFLHSEQNYDEIFVQFFIHSFSFFILYINEWLHMSGFGQIWNPTRVRSCPQHSALPQLEDTVCTPFYTLQKPNGPSVSWLMSCSLLLSLL